MAAYNFDVVVIGSGAAGLTAALNLADRFKVGVLAKAGISDGSTAWAQGGIAAVLEPGDTFESHIQDTIVAGAGLNNREAVEFVVEHAPLAIEKLAGANEDQTTGIKILARSIEEPLRQIVANAGEDAAVVLNRVREGKGTFGYNAQTGEYGDMIELGILDPTKVTRLALQNAASVAGLLLTTEVMIAESPKEEEHAHGAPGGGMGGMGGMDM